MRWAVAVVLLALWLLRIAVVGVDAPAHVLLVLAQALLVAQLFTLLTRRPAA